ncbi:MAG: hypothetical protein K2X39_00090 [Silvanigrellaceae bacterium]|nr:hypothetical protein [Silvanigrellaceae bacterium]
MDLIKKIQVIGGVFKEFFASSDIISVQQLESLINNNQYDKNCYEIYFGQGNNADKVLSLWKFVNQSGLKDKYKFITLHNYQKASRQLTHKHKPENVMISEPYAINEKKYGAYLLIDEKCIDMQDHLTGQHIPGMILLEAARQASNAFIEKFYLKDNKSEKISFITNDMEIKYHHFVFPFEAKIVATINTLNGLGANRQYISNISVIQFGINCVDIKANFSTFISNYIRLKENEISSKLINNCFKNEMEKNVLCFF